MSKEQIQKVQEYFLKLQDDICRAFEEMDGEAKFIEDAWERPNPAHGWGRTRVMANGAVFEKAGCNFSRIHGDSLPPASVARRPQLQGCCEYEAFGVSTAIYGKNPHTPTSQFNVRIFVAQKEKDAEPIWWFGGGFALSPLYPVISDCKAWHQMCHDTCKPFGEDLYPHYKKWCDDYFFITHRNERCGIGGLFFDDVNQFDFETCFRFIQSVGNAYVPGYLSIVERRKDTPYGEKEVEYMEFRRGRGVEFDLVCDRGTHFGLQAGARTESIMIAMPPRARWGYCWKPEPGSREADLMENFQPNRDWLNVTEE